MWLKSSYSYGLEKLSHTNHMHTYFSRINLMQQISIECQLLAQFCEVLKRNENLSGQEPWLREAWWEASQPLDTGFAVCGRADGFYLELRLTLCETGVQERLWLLESLSSRLRECGSQESGLSHNALLLGLVTPTLFPAAFSLITAPVGHWRFSDPEYEETIRAAYPTEHMGQGWST